MRELALAFFIALFALVAGTALAQNQTAPASPPGPDFYYYHHGWGWHGMFFHPFGSLLALIILVFIIAMIFRGVRYGWGPYPYGWRHGAPGRSRALEILEERFARGEIDKAEFEDRRRSLGR